MSHFTSSDISKAIRIIREVRKTQHQNPKFGHTQGEIKKKLAKKYISIQWGMKLRKPSILVIHKLRFKKTCKTVH